jgi:soluble lytic murein transglycosylase
MSYHRPTLACGVLTVTCLIVLGVGTAFRADCETAGSDTQHIQQCLRLEREGSGHEAISRLLEMVPVAEGRARLEMELAVGNLLVKYRRPEQAGVHLEAAAQQDWPLRPYAQILLARAFAEMEVQPDRIRELASGIASGEARSLLVDEACYLLVKAFRIDDDQGGVVETAQAYIALQPEGKWLDEVRWYLADAYYRSASERESYDVCGEIWYETPASRYALEARKRLTELQERFGYPARPLSADEHYEFIRSLRRSGRHAEALDEILLFKSRYSGHPKSDGVLLLEASSAYETRRNVQSVEAAQTLRSEYPNSEWVAAASIYAIRALRRTNSTSDVRRWCQRVIADHADREEAYQAMYHLATHMANTGLLTDSPELLGEGRRAFVRLIEQGGRRGPAEDGLWQYAWFQIRTGEREAALETFEELLDRFPESGYRWGALFWVGKLSLDVGAAERAVDSWRTVAEEEPYGYYGYRSNEMLAAIGSELVDPGSDLILQPMDRLEELRGSYHYDLAGELKRVGLYGFAANELAAELARHEDPGLRFALADLRAAAGEGTQAIKEIRAEFERYMDAGDGQVPEELLRIVYPLHHWSLIREEAQKYDLDPWLAAALIRNESLFYCNATSSAGAIGLMQIMPETGRVVAEELGLPTPTVADLYDPVLNIRYGMYYLHKRVEEFGGDLVRAVCSYNAGVEAVRQWAGQNKVTDPDEWIELIPYTETRLYIKGILGDLREYRRLYQ